MGEYGLSRAINSNGGEMSLWKLIETPPASYHIRQETKDYYSKLLATIIVAKNPERYGFEKNPQLPDAIVRVLGYLETVSDDLDSWADNRTVDLRTFGAVLVSKASDMDAWSDAVTTALGEIVAIIQFVNDALSEPSLANEEIKEVILADESLSEVELSGEDFDASE